MTSSRLKLCALRQLVRDSSERTVVAKENVEKKRQKRKQKAAAEPKQEVPKFEQDHGHSKKSLVNSVQVEDWFREGLNCLYGGKLELPQRGKWWTAGERKNAKSLLDLYGEADVKKAVSHLCETWHQRVEASDGVLAGIPSIGYLVSRKDTIFAEVKGLAAVPKRSKKAARRKNSKDSDEYRPPEKPNDVGWYV
jgi:hypothetical protein